MLSIGTQYKYKDLYRLKANAWGEIFHENSIIKKAGRAI